MQIYRIWLFKDILLMWIE